MKSSLILLALGVASSVIQLTAKSKPVRLGKGDMTFETVPGWGLDKDGFPSWEGHMVVSSLAKLGMCS